MCTIASAALLLPASAWGAEVSYRLTPFSPLTGAGSGLTLDAPGGIAVDESTGNVFVNDGTASGSASEDVAILGGEGGEPADVAPPFGVPGFNFNNGFYAPGGAVVDDITGSANEGTLYVSDSRNKKLKLLTRNSTTEHYGVSGELTATPGLGFTEGVAINGRSEVFVADNSNRAVVEFDSDGIEINRISTSDLPGGPVGGPRPGDVAVDAAGDLFVQEASDPHQVFKWPANDAGEIESDAVPVEVPGAEGATGIGVGGASNTLYVVFEGRVVAYDARTLARETEFGDGVLEDARRLVVNSRTERIYVSDKGNADIAVFARGVFPTVATGLATAISPTEGTLTGSVNPEGQAGTECWFEYGTTVAYGTVAPCAQSLPVDESAHPETAVISGLAGNTTYHYRIVAANENGIEVKGADATFTFGAPKITEVRARDADQTSATLEAKINPSGFTTSYRFEWGATTALGHVASEGSEPVPGGSPPARVTAAISGLSPQTTYYYRLLAENGEGRIVASPIEELETLDLCGLPDGRCFELVSDPEVGLVGRPSLAQVAVATSGPGGLAYLVENGLPDATAGAAVLYRALRGAQGWASVQISPELTHRSERNGSGSETSATQALSRDLSCGFVVTAQPLPPDDPRTRPVVEAGFANLYRQSIYGPPFAYAAVTDLPPENAQDVVYNTLGGQYPVIGMSRDCAKVVFSTKFHYSGIPGTGTERLYEWDEGVLRNVGLVPAAAGEAVVEAHAGGLNAVSDDGSRVFFSAVRQTGNNPGEEGTEGVFVREGDRITRDLSLSETSTPDMGATYQWATSDGSRVFFTANAGLTDETSASGTDLYEYNLETGDLVDRSVEPAAGGAAVGGMLGASEDGSVVYFAALGQLIAGAGSTLAQNQSAGTYSVYAASRSGFRYVGSVSSSDLNRTNLVSPRAVELGEPPQKMWTSRVSPDGRYLLFESTADVTGYESGGAPQVYLFDAQGGAEATVCVSCRQDGKPSVGSTRSEPLLPAGFGSPVGGLRPPVTLFQRQGRPAVLFKSPDDLAPGAIEGKTNLYEWAHGQVFLLASETQGFPQTPTLTAGGADADGANLYLRTSRVLTWEDHDRRASIYDARVGGGFPQPQTSPPACDPDREGACQGSPSGAPALPGPTSSTFHGPGNAAQKHRRYHKTHKKHHRRSRRCKAGKGRKHHCKAGKDRHGERARHANRNGRAGK